MSESSYGTPVSAIYHADALPSGARLGEFEVLALLGVGGFGMVYQAFDHSLHRSVAIKEYMPASLAGRTPDLSVAVRALADVPAFEAGLRSFIGEARMLAQFDHPSLVKVFRFWEAHHTAYMVMPLYSGMTFKQARLQMRSPPPEAWLRQVLWSVLGALRTLHNSNTLHRDISPDNIFLQDVGPPVLLDLGAARQAISDRERKHTAVLKVNYAPIEQYASGDADLPQGPWSDLYSLAAVVYGCLCNDVPDPSTLRAIRDRMVPFARVARTVGQEFGQTYSPAFVNAITQALALQPQERPQSIEAFLQLLEMPNAPAPMQSFDFRAALGDIWVEPTDQPSGARAMPTVDLSTPKAVSAGPIPAPAASPSYLVADAGDTMLLEDVQDTMLLHGPDTLIQGDTSPESIGLESNWPERHSMRPAPPTAPSATATPQRPWVRWAGVAAVVAVITAGTGVYTNRTSVKAASNADQHIITEMADPAPKPAPTPAIAPPAAAVDTAPASAEPAPDTPAPAFVEKTDPRALSQTAPKPAPVRKPPPAPVPVAATPEPAPAMPNTPPTPASHPTSAPKPAAPTLCADSSALTRSMCLRSECRLPASANLPVCVEFRKQMEPLEVRSSN
ncbi:serine/threonine protein kinase [Giesbergeria anulus]|uniref:non-specific serine/threonine protein kinase n=1 Tax=Giesbergeria anulus TaxID=180197 RepID=A0A1H9QPD6_9BURK|nr:serine/threonine-protein kinase [Giesbergeria anulus]SER62322.1 Serine/threonine protein kinase [Giesbergeria anulus]